MPHFTPKHLLHGSDYNPEQWLDRPDIWQEDMRLMRLAGINCVTLGVFSWASLETSEGQYNFGWMDTIFDLLEENEISVILATPSGGKPNWLALRHPETRRCRENGEREPQCFRHNHCPTSPVFRERIALLNWQLAERYGFRSNLIAWHVSNELGGYCYCPLCKAAFRRWLADKYGGIETLNKAWWSRFWSNTFSDWSEIDHIDNCIHGLQLDWKRFMTDQVADYLQVEIEPLKEITPKIPVTSNFMYDFADYDYTVLHKSFDFVSWDSYPNWLNQPEDRPEWWLAMQAAFTYDQMRSYKPDENFLLIESSPDQVNWRSVSPLHRPGLTRLNGLQAVAHGSQGACYFQFRQGRGASEKFHAAVVSHEGSERTRCFREVAHTSELLRSLPCFESSAIKPKVALLFDTEVRWAIQHQQAPQNLHKQYALTCHEHYAPLWSNHIPTNVIDQTAELEQYRLVVAPMLHLLRDGFAERLLEWVAAGGTLLTTYWSGYVDSSDLCFEGGFPGPLRPSAGIWVEECDALPESSRVSIVPSEKSFGEASTGTWKAKHYCELVHCETATPLAWYDSEFYKGMPALTKNRYGDGTHYHLAARLEHEGIEAVTHAILSAAKIEQTVMIDGGGGFHARIQTDPNGGRHLFLMNYTSETKRIHASQLPADFSADADYIRLDPWSGAVLSSTALSTAAKK